MIPFNIIPPVPTICTLSDKWFSQANSKLTYRSWGKGRRIELGPPSSAGIVVVAMFSESAGVLLKLDKPLLEVFYFILLTIYIYTTIYINSVLRISENYIIANYIYNTDYIYI